MCYLYNDNLRKDFHSAESLEARSDNTEPRGHGNIVGCREDLDEARIRLHLLQWENLSIQHNSLMKELLSLFQNMGSKQISFSYQLYFSAIFSDAFNQPANFCWAPAMSKNLTKYQRLKANKTGSLQSRCLHYGGGDNMVQCDKDSCRVRIVCAHGRECQPARDGEERVF